MDNAMNPALFYQALSNNGISFFAGVPDSLLKDICQFINDNVSHENHIIAANEGNAMALGIGYHLATGEVPMIYMQNSGIGNVVNPLLSLADPDVYSIPALLMIGWRGEPGVKDEPQHKKQGRITLELLDTMEIPYDILDNNLSDEEVTEIVRESISRCKSTNSIRALVVKKGFFSKYSTKDEYHSKFSLLRERAIELVVERLDSDDFIVGTTGLPSRELFENREQNSVGHQNDFLTVGGMGHANQIALGIALNRPEKRIICLDGDGALLMHMGSMAIIGSINPENYIHVLLNNGAHDSVGGQETVALGIDCSGLARNMGYKYVFEAEDEEGLIKVLTEVLELEGPIFLEIKLRKGWRSDIGRPTETPQTNKTNFMRELLG